MTSTGFKFDDTANVNTGSGNQTNVTNNHYHARQRVRRSLRFIAAEEIRRRAERFVAPAGFPFAAFTRSSTVVLSGTSESGARTTALMLLTARGNSHLDELRVLDDRSDDEDPALDTTQLKAGERLLLDLCATDDDRVRAMQPDLEAYQAEVTRKQARLVLLVRPDQVSLLADALAALRVDVDRPDGAEVLRAHLVPEGIRLPDPPPPVARLADCLRSDPVGRIADLARVVVKARDTGQGKTIDTWLAAAMAARFERAVQAQKLFSGDQQAARRALLVAAAFLPGAPVEALATAEQALHREIEIPAADEHVLDGTHLAERMATAHLRADGCRTVEFTDFALDSALRTHFWTYFPGLRAEVAEWVGTVAVSEDMPYEAAADLVDRYAELQLTTGAPEPLLALARTWSDHRRGVALAAQAVAIGLRDNRSSTAARRYVYHRATDHSLPTSFARVLVDACVEDIAPTRPFQALVRLHHFTRHRDTKVVSAALDALVGLVRKHGLHRWLLDRLLDQRMDSANRAILLALDLPRHMATETRTRDNQVQLWEALLRDTTRVVPPDDLWRWIGTDPALVVRACAGRSVLLNELFVLARAQVRQAQEAQARQAAIARAEKLLPLIDAALDTSERSGRA
ncbi:hypothetical protein [Actinokineospora cianjurensis]|uniref:Uncharacterized protein n=1 Tax=Actinokineospora cianjurensis TaxID=585224 RepID=A0A421B870_9PSEU|nr:hypothetical protein [Actinokineospora cianjurensis]RLK60716.1 hypothetical protein CLV68_1225 [Actinokineospora cianjurensis]